MRNKYQQVNKDKFGKFTVIAFSVGIIICLFLVAIFLYANVLNKNKKEIISTMEFENGQMQSDIYLDLSKIGYKLPISLLQKTVDDVNKEIDKFYKWDINIVDANPNEIDHETYELKDVFRPYLSEYVNSIYAERASGSSKSVFGAFNTDKVKYTFEIDRDSTEIHDSLETELDKIITKINTKPHTGEISGFDKEKNEFTFTDNGANAFTVDKDKLFDAIYNDISQGMLVKSYKAEGTLTKTDGPSVQKQYKILKKYETRTTRNEVRNENVRLACEAINGLIIKPGEEFSFNKTLGERTEEKGYGYAPAYLGGLVVNEIGGGVCQVSTTLYNTVFGAGLSTTTRHSHTYAPQYISPGLDATVSWPAIDYTFVNDSPYAIGIKASYENRNCKVEIFGVPKLKQGEEVFLVSKQIETYPIELPIIIDRGDEVEGTEGSKWDVFKVTRVDGKEVDRIHSYYVDYIGYQPKILRSNLKKKDWESIIAREEEEGQVPGKGSLSPEQSAGDSIEREQY